MRTPFARFDWSLRSCGARGHVTFRPTETELAERLHVVTPVGEAWRCLRCETFVVGPPQLTGPADAAPIVLRGRALKDATILRVLAVERFVRGLFLLALAYGVYRFDGSQDSIRRTLATDLPLLDPLGRELHVSFEDSGPVRFLQKALSYDHSTLVLIMIGVLGYGVLQLVEGIGLWRLARWGEYVAVVATSAFVPWELYELVGHPSVVKAVLLLVNLAAVVYLVWTKRLFGARGGHAAFEAERHAASVLEVERAAVDGVKRQDRVVPTAEAAT
ncbi:DUF2127 domain-containing protein [soil metagenome]